MDNEKNIKLFREKMKQSNITFVKLQELTNIPDATLNNYFSGKVKNPKVSNVLKIAEALDIPQESLYLTIPENPTVPDKPDKPLACPCERVKTLELLLSKEEGKNEHAERRIADLKEQTEKRIAEIAEQVDKRIAGNKAANERRVDEAKATAKERIAENEKRLRDHKNYVAALFALFVCVLIFAVWEVVAVDFKVHNLGIIRSEDAESTSSPPFDGSGAKASMPAAFGEWYLSQTWTQAEAYTWNTVFECLSDEKDRSFEIRSKVKNPVHVALIIGNYYHSAEDCNMLKTANVVVAMDEQEAIERGFEICERCK